MSRPAVNSDTDFEVSKPLKGTAGWLDDRFGGARGVRIYLLRKVYPDHWSFLLGEIALYSFFFVPSMTEVTYHGSYMKLDGIKMSEAYASTLRISFDVRGGLLIRQIHHWAADLFVAALMIHMLRVFFTGAFRKPREVNWLIGIGLFTLALIEGLFGYSLPDDQLSGAGLRIFEGVLQGGIPIVGTYLAYFLFGGPFPGHDIVPRMYVIHILLIPAILLALITAHIFIMFWQKHTQMPAKGNTERNVTGQPSYPYFIAKTSAWFMFIFGALALLSTFASINPIWLYGPYSPVAISSASQPDFYMGILEGCHWASSSAGRHSGRSSSDGPPVTRRTTTSTTGRGTPRCAPASAWPPWCSTASCGSRARTTSSPTSCRSRCTPLPGSPASRSSRGR